MAIEAITNDAAAAPSGAAVEDEREAATMEASNGDGHAGLGETLASLEERIGPQIEQVRDALVSLNEKAVRLMRQYPGLCLLGAVGAGFLIGRLASSRR